MGSKNPPYLPNRSQSSRTVLATQGAALYSGPIPPASELAQYEAACPGMADRIMSFAEKQLEHRHKMDNESQNMELLELKAEARDSIAGIVSGCIVSIVAFAASFGIAAMGHEIPAAIVGAAGVPGIVGAFVKETRLRRNKRADVDK